MTPQKSDYDKRTEVLANEYALNSGECPPHTKRDNPAWHYGINDFTAGRLSAKLRAAGEGKGGEDA